MLNLNERAQAQFNQPLSELSHAEIYKILLDLVQEKTTAMPQNEGKRKLYYISAEFLIGKLLSNNLLNLGLYDEVAKELAENGTSLAEVEEAESEPSLGNGGLGRLAACFLDSIATLGLNGDGVGLNYHFGLFRQYFEDNKQSYKPDEWLDHPTWLSKSDISYKVPYGKFTLQSTLYEIDVPGYNQPNVNKLRLFDLDTVNPEIIEEEPEKPIEQQTGDQNAIPLFIVMFTLSSSALFFGVKKKGRSLF